MDILKVLKNNDFKLEKNKITNDLIFLDFYNYKNHNINTYSYKNKFLFNFSNGKAELNFLVNAEIYRRVTSFLTKSEFAEIEKQPEFLTFEELKFLL